MEQGFITAIQKMTTEQGAQVLLNGAWRKWLADYMRGQYPKETALFKQILEANCANYINSAEDVPERKQTLLVRLEDDPGISVKKSAEYLDLLGMILKGDSSKCGLQSPPTAPAPQSPAPMAWYISRNGKNEGPFDHDGLLAKALNGELTANTPVWKQGMTGWVAAGTVTELAAILAQVPPPPPRQANPHAEELYQKGEAAFNSKNYPRAVELFRTAADQGHAEAQCILGVCYENGIGVAQDYATAVELFRTAADQGYAEAQCVLGVCYENGTGVAQDYAKAVEWHRKAAEQGHSSAQFLLGVCYGNGDGVARDLAAAAEWFRKAANQGNTGAQFLLGGCYARGDGVTQDDTKAAEWYRTAADQGHAMAQCLLGGCYELGTGVVQDYAAAAEWYRKAADQGQTAAQNALNYLKTTGKI